MRRLQCSGVAVRRRLSSASMTAGPPGVIATSLCGYTAAGWEEAAVAPWMIAGMLISIGAQVGDLFESGLKRRFKVKDSGTILPGHGGLLDRVDGLGAVSILSTLIFLSVPSLPGLLGL